MKKLCARWVPRLLTADQKCTNMKISQGKIMPSVFWDAEGILFIDYLEKSKTVTREYYSNLLNRLDKKNSWEKTRFPKEKYHLSSGQCTRPQKCFGNGKIKGSALWIAGTSYFPDFAPSDFYLFLKLKLFRAGKCFSSNQEAIAAVEGYFADLTKNHYRDGIMALEHCWNKFSNLKRDYFEK